MDTSEEFPPMSAILSSPDSCLCWLIVVLPLDRSYILPMSATLSFLLVWACASAILQIMDILVNNIEHVGDHGHLYWMLGMSVPSEEFHYNHFKKGQMFEVWHVLLGLDCI